MPLNRICSSGLPALAASMFCGVEKANYQQHVLLRASSVPSLAIQRSWQSRRFWWDANCDDISCFCDIGHDVKSAVHMGCVTSGGLVEQFHSPFHLCCAMSSAWKFLAQVQRDAVQHVASTSMPILDSTDRAGRVVVRYTRCSLWTCYRLS